MDVQAILKISGGEASFADIFGGPADLPGITLGVITRLILDMRASGSQGDRELPSIPIEELAGCDSYYIAIDNDWSQGTAPKMTRTSGISVVEENGLTLFKAELPNTAAIPGLAAAIEAAATKSITLHAEIGGTKAGIGDVFAYSFSLVVRNRIWLPDGSPEDIPSDPDYLNTVQVTALINAAVAEALEDIVGEAGPPPTITIGTVTSGATASATLTPGAEPGAYALDLVLPVGPKGNMPTLAVGTVEEGEASAEIVTAEGGFVLNLTVPRGLSGAGVAPRGIWASGTTYALHDAVRHGGAWWRSLQDGNVAHTPPVGAEADAWWETIVKDGSNGIDAEPFLRVYNDTDDVGDPGWHDEYQPGDIYFRDSIDGGATWTVPIQITAAPQVILLFNPDATTDWTPLTPGATYSTGTGKFMRARQAGGVWGLAWSIHDLDSQALRVQFSAGGGSPTWHATLQPGDRLVRFYNVLATIDKTITISDGTFDVADIQLCSISDPWHAVYAEGDRYRKISTDGGATFSLPIQLFGDAGIADYINDCKLRLLRPATTAAAHLLIEASYDRDFANVINLINTATVTADRAKVLGLSGGEFVEMPDGGFSHAFASKVVVVDMSSLELPAYIRYRWIYSGSPEPWLYTFFPSSGEAVTVTGGAATTGSMQVFLQGVLSGDGRWSVDEGATWRESGAVINDLPLWTLTVTFKAVSGYTTPADTTATITAGGLTVVSAIYEVETVTGDNAYILNGADARLVAQNVTDGFGSAHGVNGTSFTYYITDGKLYRYSAHDGASVQVGASTDWTKCAAFHDGTNSGAVGIRGGALYAVTYSGIASKIGSLTDWTDTNGFFAVRGAGYLYRVYPVGAMTIQLAGNQILPLPSVSFGEDYGFSVDASGNLLFVSDTSAIPTGITGVSSAISTNLMYTYRPLEICGFAMKTTGAISFVRGNQEFSVTHGYGWLWIGQNGRATYSVNAESCYAIDENGDLYIIDGSYSVSGGTATITKTFVSAVSLSSLTAKSFASSFSPYSGVYLQNASDLYFVNGTAAPVQVLAGKLVSYVSGGALPLVITQEAP